MIMSDILNNIVAGVDEAGRGPLIGPLVIAVAAISESKMHLLKELGVKDSKLLTEKQREDILKELEKIVHYELVILTPQVIDDAVLSRSYNLNWLEADNTASIINKLDVKLSNNVAKAIIDCPSNNIPAYTSYVAKSIDNKEIKLVVEHKADLNHLIVGAASIIAKVTREKELEKIKRRIKLDFGSGYPSDPKTKAFLEKYHDDKKLEFLFRKSWAPYQNIKNKMNQRSLGEF
jgi:ribonuclease HII